TNEHGFSMLMTCNGAGALGAAFSLAVTGKMRHRGKRLLLGAFLYCLSVIAFATAPHLSLGCFFLVIAGWFLLTFLMTANTMIQTLAPDDLRGRVFSLYSLALIGTTPLGALMVGALAKVWGPRPAVQFGASVAAVFVVAIYLRCPTLWKEK
ncbi:MAG: MFS transporter, partial [Abitibacteriaceae bacterium]|nr:MFS transporter [Abditibacteriaceae bacterium]